METKTSKAIGLYKAGKFKESLSILKTFKLGITKEDKVKIEIAHEIENGRSAFYKMVGINTAEITKDAHAIIKKIWL